MPILRHPDNTNLSLHYESTFEGLPVMVEKGPFITECLTALKRVIDLALREYPRLLAFRVDLRLPTGIRLPEYAYTNEVISRFLASFKAKIEHNRSKAREQNRYAHGCKVRYFWVRERGQGQTYHYHLLILLNRDAYYTIGRLQSEADNMISRMVEAWASALGLSVDQVKGLVNIPDNAIYRVDQSIRAGRVDELPELFRRASYLCKAVSKTYGDRQRSYGYSRG